MSIPNVTSLSKRIKEGSEGGGEFARFLNLLLIGESKKEGKIITTFSDAAGDYKGVDCIISEGAMRFFKTSIIYCTKSTQGLSRTAENSTFGNKGWKLLIQPLFLCFVIS